MVHVDLFHQSTHFFIVTDDFHRQARGTINTCTYSFVTYTMIKVYYWPFLARGGAVIRMLAEAGVPYEHVSDMGRMSQVCAAFGATTPSGNLAPPVVEDGDVFISQSIAASMYIGKKCGFPAPDDVKAIQLMDDIKDLFESGIGKNNEDGKKLKIYLHGDGSGKPSRFATFAAAIERNVVGPYFFGENLSFVDFYFANLYAMYSATTLAKLQAKTGEKDVFDDFPKLKAIANSIVNLESTKKIAAPVHLERFEIKDEVIEAYASS